MNNGRFESTNGLPCAIENGPRPAFPAFAFLTVTMFFDFSNSIRRYKPCKRCDGDTVRRRVFVKKKKTRFGLGRRQNEKNSVPTRSGSRKSNGLLGKEKVFKNMVCGVLPYMAVKLGQSVQ